MNNTLNVAQVYGTVGGLLTVNMVHLENYLHSAGLTFLTTFLSFALPIVYKKVAKNLISDNMNFAFENIFKHWPSTLAGAIIGLMFFSLVWPLEVSTIDQAMPVFLIIVPFLLYGNRPGGSTPLMLALLFIGLIGCSEKSTPQTSVVSDSSYVKVTENVVKVPGATVTAGLDLDSLLSVLNALGTGKQPASQPQHNSKTDPTGKTELSYWVDQFGRLQIACEKKDDEVKTLKEEIFRLQKSETKIPVPAPVKSKESNFWIELKELLYCALFSFWVTFLIWFFWGKKKNEVPNKGNLSDTLTERYS